MLESYHFFITLRFHDSGDQESYVSFWKILLILVIISIFFCSVGLHITLTWVSGFILQIKPVTNLNLIADNKCYIMWISFNWFVNFLQSIWFQVTFHCNVPNFVAKFKSSFQNSQASL